MNLAPLREYRDFRLLFIGQVVSFLGSMISYVAVPYQIYELTKSSLLVGLLGSAQLLPLVIFGLLGGSVADNMDRRKLLLFSELLMCLGCLGLLINAALPQPSVVAIFILVAFMQAANGFHRPAMEALSQKLVQTKDYAAVAALSSLRHSLGSVIGPALGGLLIAWGGTKFAYIVDFVTFLWAVLMIVQMRPQPVVRKTKEHLGSILEGLRFAWVRPVLMGTYIVDIIAMSFAFPAALFPAIAEPWGGAKAVGTLFSAMAAGALVVALFSGWANSVKRHGAAVAWSAGTWGLAIIGLGYATNLWLAALAIAIAGALDGVSALFRGVIWNETIPNEMRGRLASLEMISYMMGPLLGSTRAGWMAAVGGNQFSIVSGGVLCVAGVIVCALLLPAFWKYRAA